MVDISLSLVTNKLLEIWKLDLSLLQTLIFINHLIRSFFIKANFCASGHALLHYLCHLIQTDRLPFYHSPADIFHALYPLQLCMYLKRLVQFQQCLVSLQFPLLDVVITMDAMAGHWCFTFRIPVYPYCFVKSHKVLCIVFI